jgi:hypothetical protein
MIQMAIQQHFRIVKIIVLLALYQDILSVRAQYAMPAPVVVPSPVSIQYPSYGEDDIDAVAPPVLAPAKGLDGSMFAPSIAVPLTSLQPSTNVGFSQLRGGYGGMGSGSTSSNSNDDVHDVDSADNNDDVNDADSEDNDDINDADSMDSNDDINDADSMDSNDDVNDADSMDSNDDVNDADSMDNNDDVNDADSADGATTEKSSLSMQSMTSAGTTVPRLHVATTLASIITMIAAAMHQWA